MHSFPGRNRWNILFLFHENHLFSRKEKLTFCHFLVGPEEWHGGFQADGGCCELVWCAIKRCSVNIETQKILEARPINCVMREHQERLQKSSQSPMLGEWWGPWGCSTPYSLRSPGAYCKSLLSLWMLCRFLAPSPFQWLTPQPPFLSAQQGHSAWLRACSDAVWSASAVLGRNCAWLAEPAGLYLSISTSLILAHLTGLEKMPWAFLLGQTPELFLRPHLAAQREIRTLYDLVSRAVPMEPNPATELWCQRTEQEATIASGIFVSHMWDAWGTESSFPRLGPMRFGDFCSHNYLFLFFFQVLPAIWQMFLDFSLSFGLWCERGGR